MATRPRDVRFTPESVFPFFRIRYVTIRFDFISFSVAFAKICPDTKWEFSHTSRDAGVVHDVLDHLLLVEPECFGLFGNLLVDKRRAHEAGADHVSAHAVLCAFFR
jgi:hypothetical protein